MQDIDKKIQALEEAAIIAGTLQDEEVKTALLKEIEKLEAMK